MTYLKLHRDEPEQPAPPAPLPFRSPDRSWREAGSDPIDSIAMAEQALEDVEQKMSQLAEQADELGASFSMSEWIDDEDDDGPWAA